MRIKLLLIMLLFIILLSSCESIPINSEQVYSSTTPTTKTLIVPSITPITTPTIELLPTVSAIPTLNPTQTNEILLSILHDPIDCLAPCFWGIIPGITTQIEVNRILDHMGLKVNNIWDKGNLYYDITYNFSDTFHITPNFAIKNGIVQKINIRITPGPDNSYIDRKWSAYSPESLINRYGKPSRVTIAIDWGGYRSLFALTMYFDDYDMVIQYNSYDIFKNTSSGLQVCPLTDQQDYIQIWMGKQQDFLPTTGIPLEKATFISEDEFVNLMAGKPENACFFINEDEINNS